MAHTLGEAVAPRRNSVSANDVADSLLSSIKKRIRERLAAHWCHGFKSNLKSQREARGAFAETISWRSWSQSGHSHRDGKHDQVSIIIRTNCAQNVKEKWIIQNVYIRRGDIFRGFAPGGVPLILMNGLEKFTSHLPSFSRSALLSSVTLKNANCRILRLITHGAKTRSSKLWA